MTTMVKAVGDGLVVARRNLIKVRRVPDLLVAAIAAPIMFILLFAYVLGSGVSVPGVGYREFLIGGIFTQTMVFGATATGSGLAQDIHRGIIDRFRSLPMSHGAVLFGRTTSDLVTNLIVVVIMTLTGLLVGWRIRGSALEAVGAYLLLLAFAYALSWMMATIGLSVRTPEVFGNISFMATFPLTFIANTFVATENLPGPLKVIAEWNPVSAIVQAVRELFGNVGPATPEPDALPLRYPIAASLIWIGIILAVFVPLAIRRYHHAVRR